MRLNFGNMWEWYLNSDLFLVTTNSSVKLNEELVMGSGIARQAKDRIPTLPRIWGRYVLEDCGNFGVYGLIVGPQWPQARIGAFQVKFEWHKDASLALIQLSTGMLNDFIIEHPDISVALNYPGIGNGNLKRSEVEPIISTLPDNVTIWQYESQDGDP